MIEFILLAVGAVVGAFLRYEIIDSPIIILGLPVSTTRKQQSATDINSFSLKSFYPGFFKVCFFKFPAD